MSDYNVRRAFERIEEELIASMIRNMKNHRAQEDEEGFQWEQWQALQLKELEAYRRRNQKLFGKKFREINEQIELAILKAREDGNMEQELALLEMLKTGKIKKPRATKNAADTNAEFFKMNDRKMDALIKATVSDMERAETAILRMADDKYRKIIFDAQVYANSGAGTYEQAVDMATRDFLAAGLNCVEYKNGARHTLKDYAEMALKTATKRAYLTGEGEKRKEWGIPTVIMNKRGNPCPLCLPFVGKVMIDDVWSGGSSKDGKYPLMSDAISKGLYHPRCRDSHSTYLEGISTPPDDKFTKDEIEEIEAVNKAEAKKQNAQRQAEKYGRLGKFSLDLNNKKNYKNKEKKWLNLEFLSYSGIIKAKLAKANNIFLNPNEKLFRYAPKVKKLKGFEDFTCHATPDVFQIDLVGEGNPADFIDLSPEEYAERIKNSKGYHGGDIRIISCSAGAKDDGAAQRLADALGVRVLAPTETVNMDEDGLMFLSDNDVLADMWYESEDKSKYKETGYWKIFEPKKGDKHD